MTILKFKVYITWELFRIKVILILKKNVSAAIEKTAFIYEGTKVL